MDRRRGSGQLHPFDHLGDDRLDDGRDHRCGDGRTGRAVEQRHRTGHRRAEGDEHRAVHQGGMPIHLHGDLRPGAARGHVQTRHDRAGRNQAHRLHGDARQPRHRRADPLEALAAGHGDEPAEYVLHRDRQAISALAAGQTERRMRAPAGRGATDTFESVGQRLVVLRVGTATAGPDHQLASRPRRLQLDRLDRQGLDRDRPDRVGRGPQRLAAQPSTDVAQAVQRVDQVGDHLVALVTGQRPRRVEVMAEVDDQPIEDARRTVVVTQQPDGLVGATTVDHRPQHSFDLR